MIKDYTIDDFYKLEKVNSCYVNKKEKKELYGEVRTPLKFVEKVLSIIPDNIYKNPHLKWLDPGAGTGNFSIILYYKLMKHLEPLFPSFEERNNHIITNMIYMVEIQQEYIVMLNNLFGKDANIYEGDFLEYNTPESIYNNPKQYPLTYDMIIGNPPFNCNGLKKVPTNTTEKKIQDGSTLWIIFAIKSVALLKETTGSLCIFIPSIWLKPDKQKMYTFLGQYQINKLNCLNNTETNKIFKGNAQTPSCYFLLTKKPTCNTLTIFDNSQNKYIDYYLTKGAPIPVFGQSIIKKLNKYCYINNKINYINVIKTNMPSKNIEISTEKTDKFKYSNISTCRLKLNNTPDLVINYSDKALAFTCIRKLILAHKMYGFPYLDEKGIYGISNRDNFIILKDTLEELEILQKFLSTKTALYLFEATRYRMKYLEKYAFELIPDVTNLPDFPKEINDNTIADYFQFDEDDREAIQNLHVKKYNFFV